MLKKPTKISTNGCNDLVLLDITDEFENHIDII